MGLILRQGFKSSIGFYLGVVLGAINTLFISTEFLSPDQLAISRILLENSLIFAAFSHLGTPFISDRFFAHFKNDSKKHNGFLVFILLFPLVGLTLFSCTFFVFYSDIQFYFQAKSPSIIPYLWLSLPLTFCWVYILVLESYCRVNGRTAVPTFLREVGFRGLTILLAIFLGLSWINFEIFLFLFVGSTAIIAAVLLIYIYKMQKLYLSWNSAAWTRSLVYQMLAFGSIIIIGGLGANLILFLDRNILANKIGTTAVAIFTVAAYIATIIEIPSKSIRQISGPIIADAVYRNDQKLVNSLYQKSALNLLLIGGILFFLIAFNIDQLLSILPKSEIYSKGKWVVIIIGLAKWIDMSLGLNIEIITYSRHFRVNTILIICMAFLTVYANLLLIPIYGIIGSALATGGIALLSSGIRLFYVRWRFKLSPFSKQNASAFLILLFIGILGWLIPNYGENFIMTAFSILTKSIILLFVFLLLVIRFQVSDDISILYKKFIAPLWNRK